MDFFWVFCVVFGAFRSNDFVEIIKGFVVLNLNLIICRLYRFHYNEFSIEIL